MTARPKSALHPYQQQAITHIFEHDRSLALMPVGAGKTVVTMTALQELMAEGVIERPLVFAPMRVAENVWPYEGREWEHLKDLPIVRWGGAPENWPESIWRRSRELWGQRTSAAARLVAAEARVRAKLAEEAEQRVKEIAGAAYEDDNHGAHVIAYYRRQMAPNPNQIRAAIDAVRIPAEAKLAALVAEEKRVNKEARKTLPPKTIHVTSFENLLWLTELYEPGESPFDAWVFDEIGRLKNPKSPRYKAARKHTVGVPIVVGLNATPAPEGFEDLYAQVAIIDNGKLWGKSFYKWRQRYFASDYMGFNWRLQIGAADLLLKDLNTLAFKVDEKQLAHQRSMQHSQIVIDLPPAARAAYDTMTKKMLVEIDGQEDVIAMSMAAVSMKLRQIANGFVYDEDGKTHILHEEKMHALAELIDDMGREPLLVSYEFTEDLEAIRRVWKNVPYLGQGINANKARDTIDQWNKRELPVLALHRMSAGHGLNLQAGGSHVCWYSLPWDLEGYLQLNGRVDRQGQTRACYGHHIIARDTIDQRVSDVLVQKDADQNRIIEAIRAL